MRIFELIAAGIRKLVTKVEGAVERVENTVEGIVEKIVSINDIPQNVVEARLDEAAMSAGQPLDWRHSIVDLMKLLGLDSSYDARAELAREFNPETDYSGTAKDNIWLHKQVMHELSVRGYAIPQP